MGYWVVCVMYNRPDRNGDPQHTDGPTEPPTGSPTEHPTKAPTSPPTGPPSDQPPGAAHSLLAVRYVEQVTKESISTATGTQMARQSKISSCNATRLSPQLRNNIRRSQTQAGRPSCHRDNTRVISGTLATNPDKGQQRESRDTVQP